MSGNCRKIFYHQPNIMKLHLPTRLRAALLAVVTASVTIPSTAQAITNGAVYDYTYFQHATQVHANLLNNRTTYDDPADPTKTKTDNYNFRDPAAKNPEKDDAFDADAKDWSMTVEVHNFLPCKDLNSEETTGAMIIGNGQATTNDNGDFTIIQENSFVITMDRFGNVRLLTNDEAHTIDNDIVLFQLDALWAEKNMNEDLTVSFRMTLSWDADGGLYNMDSETLKDKPKYGALTLQSAYLLSNDDSHSVIEEIDSFYTGRVLLNNYTMVKNFFSVEDPKDIWYNSGGCVSFSGTGGTAMVTLQTPGNAPAWCIYGNTSLLGLLGKDEVNGPIYKDETDKGKIRAMGENERVQFMGNNSTIWLTEGEYTYKNPTWASNDPQGNSSGTGIGFGAYKDATIIVDESVINSTVIASNATVNALGEGTVRLVINTNAIESVDLPVIIAPPIEEEEEEEEEGGDTPVVEDTPPVEDTPIVDGGDTEGEGGEGEADTPTIEAVPAIAAGQRVINFNQLGADTNVELEVKGSNGVIIALGGATIGNENDTNTTSITLKSEEEDSRNPLTVKLHNGAKTRMTSYVGDIVNEEGNLIFDGREYVDIYDEDDELVEKQAVDSRIKANNLKAEGAITVFGGIVKAVESVEARNGGVDLQAGYLEAGTLSAAERLRVGHTYSTDAILVVHGAAEIGGKAEVYGQASVGELSATGVEVYNTIDHAIEKLDNDALLTANSITTDYISREYSVTSTTVNGEGLETEETTTHNIRISYKPVEEAAEEETTPTPLLSDGVSIGKGGIVAGTIAAGTQIYIDAESTTGVTITNISGSDIQIGTDAQGNKTVPMANVYNDSGALQVNPNGGQGIIASAGNLTTDTLELPTGYTLSVEKTLTVAGGIVADGVVTTGETIATDIFLTDQAVATASEEDSAPAAVKYMEIGTLQAETLDIASGSVVHAGEINTTAGTTLGNNVSLINISEEGVVNGTISTGDAAYIYGITNKGEMKTGAGSELVNSTIANTYKTTGTTTLTNISVDNASFGGAAGDAFYSESSANTLKFSGVITDKDGSVNLNVTNVALDASNLAFDEEGKEYTYTLLSANGDNTYNIDGNLKELIYVPAYTWANIVSDGKTISVSGVYDETLYKKELVGDSKNRANTMAALEVNATVEGSAAATLHDKLGDVMHTSLKSRQELLDAISGASLSTLADSQRRGVQDVQSSLRNRIIQMGGTRDDESLGIQAWAQADSSLTSSDSGDEAVGYDYNTWGATVGANVDLSENVVVGMSFSAAYGELDVDSADKATGNNDAYYVNFFTRHQTGRWTQLLILTVGSNDMDLTRKVDTLTASGSTSGSSYSAYYELGYTLGLNEDFTHVIQPMVSASITSAKVDGYKESGTIGNAALDYDGGSYVYGSVGIGLRYQGVIYESVFERNGVLELRGQITQDFGDTTDEATVSMAGGKTNSVYGTDTSGTGFNLGAGLSIPVQMQTTIFADADMTIRTDYTGFRATVGFRYDF